MSKLTKKATVCFEPEILGYLRPKATKESRSISDIIHKAISLLTSEHAEDIADFDVRIGKPSVCYDEFVQSLKVERIF